ncbi:MAG: restriction endonuclease subunit S [Gemmatimonadetes bacterium]|nr:restriction endonuclease subunit S [Gemmatimonadota bacterium]
MAWRTVRFRELIDASVLEVGDGYRAKNAELTGGGLIFLRAAHLQDSGFDFNNADCFAPELTERVSSKRSLPHDTVVTTKGNSIGRIGLVRDSMPAFVYSPHLSYWRSLDYELLDPHFLHFWAAGPEFRAQLSGLKESTHMAPYLSLRDQRRLRITLPPCPEQRAIASVLTALDNKIELNRRMNRTLEAIAQALFRSWFIDFPVVAKAAGSEPAGADAETAASFPDCFVDSDLGPVPQGWGVSEIGTETKTVGGATPSTRNPDYWENGSIHWATPRDLASLAEPVLMTTERKITPAGLSRISSRLLPPGTVLLSSRAPIGYLAVTAIATAINQGDTLR